MEHTIIANNKSYDLPKKTLAIAEKLDKALTIDSVKGLTVKRRYEILHDFVKEVVGTENTVEILGSENLDEIDLSELAVVVLNIRDAYEKPMNDYQAERIKNRFGDIPVDKLMSLTKAVQTVSNMQMINKC